MDIGGWLRGLGLGQYEAAFCENEIDPEVLPKLTSEDLKEIGVVVIGHRRKLLAAIGELTAASAPPVAIAEPPPSTPAGDAAERRQLSVMFCDLVGSTALSARLDPEDMRGIIAAYHRCCAALIVSNGGFVAKYMGDGVLAYFGYPRAHEDDAERAVRAGLAIVEAAPKLETAAGLPLHVRLGIATGIVVVGDLLGSGESQERGIVGDTPNLAARLQSIAEPDSVVIAEGTRRLLGNLFELKDLGALDLKGIVGPAQVWAAVRASSVESRFDAMHGTALTPLVGRDEEIELLLRRWAKAKAGEGQVVLLSGEPGIGKSRLTAALMERIAIEPHVRLRYFCSPQHVDSALQPIIGHLERAARFSRQDNLATKLDKLDELLAQTETSREDVGLFAEMLSLGNDGRYPRTELTPQQRRHNTLTALVQQIEALSRTNPTLMVFEDAHWSDPSSLETLGRLVDRIERFNVLLIVTYRPEFAPPWIGKPQVTAVIVSRLGRREIDSLIDRVAGNNALPEAIRSDIAERADGVPLFAEEIAKAAIETADESEVERTIAAIPSARQAVPATLHASLMARLDRLGEAKEVAQIGAAIGREFGHELLAAVAKRTETELAIALDRLVQAGLVFRQGAPPYATYLFKHALVQDTAYGTLLREARRALNARIAEILEAQFPEIAENQPELLARHYTEAGLIEKAAALWGKAGKRSRERSALVEAIEHLTRALDQIADLPPTPALRREQIEFQTALINPLQNVKGFAAPETKAAVERLRLLIEQADRLGEPLEAPMLLFSVLSGLWVTNWGAFNGDVLRDLAGQGLALAKKLGTTIPLMAAHYRMGSSLFATGDIAQGRAHYDEAMALYDPTKHRPLVTRLGFDLEVAILDWRTLALWMLGFPEAALADAKQALKDARELGHAATLMGALGTTPWTFIWCGSYATASAPFDELIALAAEQGSLFWKAAGMAGQGQVLALSGRSSDAVKAITAAINAWRSTGGTLSVPTWLSNLARAQAELGQIDDACRCIGEAMAAVETTNERWFEAYVRNVAGEIAMMSKEPDAAKAEAYFSSALAVARRQQAKSWELRAAMNMARLWRDQGKRDEAHDLLAPVYAWFTEGFDTLDLKEAKALLQELAS
jgi:class 3 adenylate cyclase/predicted ATPase